MLSMRYSLSVVHCSLNSHKVSCFVTSSSETISRVHLPCHGQFYHSGNCQRYQDCWVLHRALLDRLFHLAHLNRNSEFEIFDDWSFLQQWNANHRVRSDSTLRFTARNGPAFRSDPAQDSRARQLLAKNVEWKRPKPEAVAKVSKLLPLYRFGYDYA